VVWKLCMARACASKRRSPSGPPTDPPRIHHGSTTDPARIGRARAPATGALRHDGAVATVGLEALSAREAEVLAALGEHLTNAEIGLRLHISVRTVESHVSSLLRKLGAADRRQLAGLAAQQSDPSETSPGGLAGLPGSWTTFVGRETEVDEVAAALATDRLVTLVGPGGIGKTRLATVVAEAVAAGFPGGGAFVDLVPVEADLVLQAVAAAVDVVERPREPLQRLVHERLRRGRTLVILDNCEHVLAAAASFARDALTACPEAVVLATSRERLGLPGEHVIAVPPLAVRSGPTGTTEGPGATEAEQLFLDRAAQAGGDLGDPTLVAEVCRRLEGMPLAIELAAARSASLGLDGLLAGFDDHLRLLGGSGGSDARHRSLRAVIDWSHDLLDDDERRMFHRLAVFRGAFDLVAATQVAADGDAATASDVVGRLADKSLLVHRRSTSGSRWRMLETVHAYALEHLAASGEQEGVERRHLAWAIEVADRLQRGLDDEGTWHAEHHAVADDLRAALALVVADPDGTDRATGYALARDLAHLAYARQYLAEARDHCATAVALAPSEAEAVAALRLMAAEAWAEMRGDLAHALLLQAAERAEAAGDRSTAAIALADAATFGGRAPATFDASPPHEDLIALVARARALAPPADPVAATHVALAAAWNARREPSLADAALANEALELARRIDDPICISNALDAVSSAEGAVGRFRATAARTRERLALLDRLPRHDPTVGGEVADIFHMATESALAVGDLKTALQDARRYRTDRSQQGLVHFPAAHMVVPHALMGQLDDALIHAAVMVEGWERTGRPSAGWMAPAFFAAALAHGLRGEQEAMARWWEHGDEIALGISPRSFARFVGPRLALHAGDVDGAVERSAPSAYSDGGLYDAYALAMRVEVAVVAGAREAEQLLHEAAGPVAENDFAGAQLLRARGRLTGDETVLRAAVAAWEALDARVERACTLLLLPDRRAEGEAELTALGCTIPPG
jgi:predicted ATPase/DNA-binding CsgD family transcriptional regulator